MVDYNERGDENRFLGLSCAQGEPGSVILSSSHQTVGNGICYDEEQDQVIEEHEDEGLQVIEGHE